MIWDDVCSVGGRHGGERTPNESEPVHGVCFSTNSSQTARSSISPVRQDEVCGRRAGGMCTGQDDRNACHGEEEPV